MNYPNNIYGYDIDSINTKDLNNKLFCTFTQHNELENFISEILNKYSILNNKIFVLSIENKNELACTYNIENGNINNIPNNTILVHRKKDSNTLYTINALNKLIESLNNGILDTNYQIDWNNYRNNLILTQQSSLIFLKTKIYKIF
jgi:hypothetical protein